MKEPPPMAGAALGASDAGQRLLLPPPEDWPPPEPASREEFDKFMRVEMDDAAKVVKAAAIKVQ